MLCPYCKGEMEKGYLQSRDGLGWNHKKKWIAALSGMIADQPLGTVVVAYRCASCKKLLIDYTDDGE